MKHTPQPAAVAVLQGRKLLTTRRKRKKRKEPNRTPTVKYAATQSQKQRDVLAAAEAPQEPISKWFRRASTALR